MMNPWQPIIALQLEMLRMSLMMTQQILEAYVSVQRQVGAAAKAGPRSIDADLSRFLAVKPGGCIGPADLKS